MLSGFYLILCFWLQVQEANAQLAEQDAEVTPVQRRIEPRSADDSLSGVVRCLCFADTFLRDGTSKLVLHSANFLFRVRRRKQVFNSQQKWGIKILVNISGHHE